MVISLVLEETEENLNKIKGNIISVASEALVGVSVNGIKEQKKEIKIPACMFLNVNNRV